MHAQLPSHVRLFGTPRTVAHQAPLSMGFPRQEYWSGVPFPPPGDLPKSGIKPVSPALAGGFFTTEVNKKKARVPFMLNVPGQGPPNENSESHMSTSA